MQLSTTLSRIVIGAALAAGAQAALAQQQLVPAQSEVQFTARQMGVPLEGQFKKFSAQVAFDPAKLATVQDYLEAKRPVTAEVHVFAPAAYLVDITLSIAPDTAAVRAAAVAELGDLFAREAEPGGVIPLSHLREAVSVSTGETDNHITSPAADITPGPFEFPVLGAVTFA